MKNKKKKGFTLVELLAVIVILAVILVIAIPQIMNTIKTARLSSIKDSAMLIAEQAEKDYLSQQVLNQDYNARSIPCEDVAKLNDDYDSCTITYNNGIATVKLKGKEGGKFSGITCTGTKDNMSCSEGEEDTPEYVYAFDQIPYFGYTYTVTDKTKCEEELPGILRNVNYPEEYINSDVPNICSNSDDVYGDGSNVSTSNFFEEDPEKPIKYEDVSSFVSKSDPVPVLKNTEEDYRNLKDSNNNQRGVFLKFKSDLSEKYVCTMYDSTAPGGFGTEPHCILSPGAFHRRNEVNSEWNQIKTLFGDVDGSKNICYDAINENGTGNVSCIIDNSSSHWECVAVDYDDVFCSYTGSSHALCRIEGSGNIICN